MPRKGGQSGSEEQGNATPASMKGWIALLNPPDLVSDATLRPTSPCHAQRQLAIKLNALSRDHADLILDISRQEEYLSEQQESLLSLQRSLEVEDAVSFKHQRSLLEVSGRIALEEDRMTAVSASIFSCLLPVRESAREKERALDEARERLTRAKERCEAENADAFDSDR